MHRSTRGTEEHLLLPWSTRASRVQPSRRSVARTALAASLLILLCLGVGIAPVGAEGGDPDPAAQKQQTEARKKEVDGQIDTLQESDDQLKAELDKLDVSARDQQAKAVTARTDLDAAHAQLDVLSRQIVDAQQLAAQARRDAANRAVAAYMRPDRETATQVLAAKDPQQLAKMHELVTDVTKYNHSVMLDRVAAENDLRTKQTELQVVRDQADHLSAEAEAAVAATNAVHDRQVAVRAELDNRIAGLQDESKSLDAQEARLSSLLAARTQEVAAQPAPAAEPAGLPEPPTTPVPTTAAPTTAKPAPSTVTPPGAPIVTVTTRAPSTTTPATPPPPKKPTGGARLSWPVIGPITSPFGARWGLVHKGIDIGVGTGTPIHAAAAGTVFFSGQIDGYGNCILIDHGGGMVTLYAHQSQLIASQGSYVAAGTTIGLVGSTGRSTGPHLHFEVRINGVAVDPMGYLP